MAKTTMFERSRTKVRFANEDMDYLFQVVLGYHTHGGASFGELFRAAAKVEDGDPESWISAFREMGGGSSARPRNSKGGTKRAPLQRSCAPSPATAPPRF
jgi:hypothetical protein